MRISQVSFIYFFLIPPLSQGFESAGGLQENEARLIFERAHLSTITFEHLWNLSNATGGGALDSRQFCLFMHLIKAAVEGQQLPERISLLTAAQFLGDVPLSYSGNGNNTSDTMHVDANRLKAALHPEDAAVIDRSLLPNANRRRRSPASYNEEDDDDSDAGSEVSHVSCWHMGMASKGTPSPNHNGLVKVSSRSGFITPTGVASSVGGSSHASPGPETSRMERAVWEAEAGVGHSYLELRLGTANLMQTRAFNRPIITMSILDPVGRLIEMPQESHPGVPEGGCIEFKEQKMRLKTKLRQLPPGCVLFFEIKHWKQEKQRFSTIAWAFVDSELMIDAGPVCSRVRCGPMILPLFKKPMDTKLQKMKRLGGRTVVLHMYVAGR